jgi:hypothetical protein
MLIAQRDLEFVSTDRAVVPVPVRLFAPEGSDKYWWCRYTIEWPDGTDASAGYGVDQIQAIVITLQMIGARIYASAYHKSGQLRLKTFGSGYGFLVPKNIRDLLIGEDKIFDG